MTDLDTTPVAVSAEEQAEFEVMRTDAVLTGRAMFLAGVLAAAETDTVGGPLKLPTDIWPDADPALVLAIWERACAVTWRTAQMAASPWLYRDRLESLRGQLLEAGHEAMGRSVQRSLGLVARDGMHPADGEDGRGH